MRVFLLGSEAEDGKIYKLSAKEKRYLFSVLRLKINDTIRAKDKNGNLYKAFIFSDDSITLEISDDDEGTLTEDLPSYRKPLVPITMMISVLKNKKNEGEVRMLTEIGVKRIILMETEFTDGMLNTHQLERLHAIMREAVQQSGANLPELIGPISFNEALTLKEGKLLILHQGIRSTSLSLEKIGMQDSVSIMIGPEGGFSDRECEKAEEAGAVPILLKTNILRSETAAVYAASATQVMLQQ